MKAWWLGFLNPLKKAVHREPVRVEFRTEGGSPPTLRMLLILDGWNARRIIKHKRKARL